MPYSVVVLIIHSCFCIYHDQTCRGTYLGNPISFSEARQRMNRDGGGYIQRLPLLDGELWTIDGAIEWGLKKLVGASRHPPRILYVYTIAPRIAPPSHPLIWSFSFWLVRDERTTPTPLDDMAGWLVLIPCPGFCVSMRHQGGAIHMYECTRWGELRELKH